MKRVLIIGGGLAGLSLASILASNRFKVILLEASPKLGGRTYSFLDESSNIEIDNGQHIMMGCYKYTLDFIKLIGACNNFVFQDALKVNFVKENFKISVLKAGKIIYPLNLLYGLINFDALNFNEKINLIRLFIKIRFIDTVSLKNLTVAEWLKIENQNQNAIKTFWEIISVGSLNCGIEKASAKIFCDVLKEIFWKGKDNSRIILPKYGLSKSFCQPAQKFITENLGEIKLSERATQLSFNENRISSVKTSISDYNNFDFVVSAIPLHALEKLINLSEIEINLNLNYSSILNVHIWLKHNSLKEDFYGLINSPIHWIFNKGDHINIVISDADYLMEKTNDEILELVINECEKFFALKKADIINTKVIKEKRATFIPSNEIINNRPVVKTKFKNLFLAGDWTNTGLPSTIESAVKSGTVAAQEILKFNLN